MSTNNNQYTNNLKNDAEYQDNINDKSLYIINNKFYSFVSETNNSLKIFLSVVAIAIYLSAAIGVVFTNITILKYFSFSNNIVIFSIIGLVIFIFLRKFIFNAIYILFGLFSIFFLLIGFSNIVDDFSLHNGNLLIVIFMLGIGLGFFVIDLLIKFATNILCSTFPKFYTFYCIFYKITYKINKFINIVAIGFGTILIIIFNFIWKIMFFTQKNSNN